MSNDALKGFESVKGGGAVWEPKQTGSKKEQNVVALTAGDNSYIIGWYLGAKTGVGKNNSTIHGLKIKQVGDDSHIRGEINDGKINIWGTGVLDALLAEQVQPGQCIAIVWKGKVPTKNGENTYHDWDVMVNNSEEPMPIHGVSTTPSAMANNGSVSTQEASVAITEDDDDDDLPF